MVAVAGGTTRHQASLPDVTTRAKRVAYLLLLSGLLLVSRFHGRPPRICELRYLFDDYALDVDRRELHRGQVMVPVAPQVFDLIEYLIRNRERVVTKEELISAIWKGRIVSDAALTTRLNAARNAIGDTGERQRLIRTLSRKGFRFVGAVRDAQRPAVVPVGSAAHSSDRLPSQPSTPRLSIVVLPFANLSGDPEQDYFVDGVTESLTTDLSRIRGSLVIGRHTAFTYKGKAVDLKQVGRELNVRYVLEGSVQRSDNQLRVNVQLVDAETASHLWAERFDKPIADLFEMQDEIIARLANALDAELIAAEARRAERSLHPDARDLVFQGLASLYKGWTPKNLTQARGFFERAIALDPESISAMLGVAGVHVAMSAIFVNDDRDAQLAAAEVLSERALSLAPDHALAHLTLGGVYLMTNRAAHGISECERALAIDRNLAFAHGGIGLGKLYLGRAAETEGHELRALRLSPRDLSAYQWMFFIGVAKVHLGSDAEAVDWLRQSIEANRSFPPGHFNLAAVLALLGAADEARVSARTGLALIPSFTLRRFRLEAPSDNPIFLTARERIHEGLRMAGVPEG